MTHIPPSRPTFYVGIVSLVHVQMLQSLDWDLSSWLRESFIDEPLDLMDVARRRLKADIKHAFEGDFDKWLAAVRFDIPEDRLPHNTSVGGIHYDISNVSCTNLQIGTTQGESPRRRHFGGLSSSVTILNRLDIKIQKMSIDCMAHVNYGTDNWAEIELQTDDAAVDVIMQIVPSLLGSPALPEGVKFETCFLHTGATVKATKGSATTEYLAPLLDGLIQTFLGSTLEREFCNVLLPEVSKFVDSLLIPLRSYVHVGLAEPSTEWLETSDSSLVDWGEVPLFHWIERFQEILPVATGSFRDFMERVFPSKEACVLQPADDLFNSSDKDVCFQNKELCIFGGGHGQKCMVQKVPEGILGALHLHLTSLKVKATNPTGDLRGRSWLLHTNFTDSSTRFSLRMHTNFHGIVGGAKISDIWGTLSIDGLFEALNVGSIVVAAFDRQSFSAIREFQYTSMACLKPAMHSCKLGDATVTFTSAVPNVSFTQPPKYVSPLLLEVAALFQNLLRVVWQFEGAMAPMVRGYALNHTDDMLSSYWSRQHLQDCPIPWGLHPDPDWHIALINPHLGKTFNCIAAGFVVLTFGLTIIQVCRQFFKRGADEEASDDDWWDTERNVVRSEASDSDDSTEALTTDGTESIASSRHRSGSHPLCLANTTTLAAAWVIPTSIISCCFLLLGSNCLYFAQTFFTLELGSEGTALKELMAYNVFFSIKGLNDRHFHRLALALFLFSGIVPYAKLVLMLFMWILPAWVVNGTWRGRILYVVDQIGKYSLTDIFVIQLISAVFSAHVGLPHEDDGGQDLAVAVRTEGRSGFFTFVMATVASLIIGHVCLYFHNEDPRTKQENVRKLDESSPRDYRRRMWFIGPMLVVLLVVILVSYTLPAFSITMSYTTLVLKSHESSLLDFFASMQSHEQHVRFGTLFGQGTFFIFALSTIILHICVLLVIWYCKVSGRWLRRMRTLAHTLQAWAALDVMLISMGLTLIEMNVSDFHHMSDHGRAVASKLVGEAVTDSRGLLLKVSLGYAFYILVAAVVAHFFLGWVVMNILENELDVEDRRSLSRDFDSAERCESE